MAKDKYGFSNTPQPGPNPDADSLQFGVPQSSVRAAPGTGLATFGIIAFVIVVALISLWIHG